ncbi:MULTISPECIES: ParA family protein [Flammeovirga]|uniref:ParA family protein n=2 Tax=Flammeovirga TaxID=59739 RepID=A0A3S9P8A2_9BACT|nr:MULTISPECIES: ParA family protein [Flammeovirga]AZQ64383.1 ParA family protein [Flammeovirga pectinis]MBB6463174.1 chromosome partitioning protein [Flammeovirga kamogawensis]QWG05972.1 ParA family protein [Flammeovirga kamogawensis]TRX67799.1 ParA family protein [Flammeovirga kamogawensis]
MAKVISFATQKGGVGKSTLLMLTASAVHNRTNKKVLVIDCDPQKSVKDIYATEGADKEQSYDVISFNWKQPRAEENFDKTLALAEKKYDAIFLDVPGRIEGKEIYFSVLVSDVVIVPVVASVLDMRATIRFLKTLPMIKEMKEKQGYNFDVFGIVNKKDQTVEHQKLKELAGIGGMEFFYSPISNLVRYKRGISTVYDITDPTIKDDEFNQYFDEFCTKCLF